MKLLAGFPARISAGVCPALWTLASFSLAVSPLRAQDPASREPCNAEAYSQFDFWLGEWEVRTEDGQVAGTSTISKAHGGCVLREEWTGIGGGTGESFNIYDPARAQWHQTWVDDRGRLLLLTGALDGVGRMVLRGERPGRDGALTVDEISWQPNDDGTVTQVWSVSTDAGATWREMFRGRYYRKESS